MPACCSRILSNAVEQVFSSTQWASSFSKSTIKSLEQRPWTFLAGIYLLKVSKRNTKTRCEICYSSLAFLLFTLNMQLPEAYSKPCQISKKELFAKINFQDGVFFAKIVNSWKSFTVFSKSFILDIWQDSECASAGFTLCE